MLPSYDHAYRHVRNGHNAQLLLTLLLMAMVVFAPTANLMAQQAAGSQISGVVQDPGGLVISDAQVTVIQKDTGLSRSTQTRADGAYTIPNLPSGPYRMTITKEGFNSYVQEGIVLQVDSNPVVDASLTVGAVTQEVVVQADAGMLETHSSGVGQVVDQERVVELPLNGRNPTQLIFIAGAATAGDPNLNTNKNYPTVSISVAGGPSNSVSYVLDGSMHNDSENNLNQPLPFPDALQEFKVETSALPAQYGFLGAATVNVITKSGGNEFHGDAFEFLRNGDLNSRNAYAVSRDSLKRNQFGGVIGGPVMRNKLFFFAGYQGTVQRSDPTTGIAFVPTQQMLTGDFTGITSPACNTKGQVTLKAPFVNNRIDPALFSTPALNLVKHLPQPADQVCGTVRFGTVSNSEEHLGLARADYQMNAKNTLFFRYYLAHLDQLSPYNNNDPLTITAPFVTYNMQFFAAGETYVITPNTVSTFHASFNRGAIVRGSPPFFTAADLGSNIVSLDPAFSMISVSGAFTSGGGGTNAGHVFTATPQITEDISMIRGTHQITAGVDWMNRIQNVLIDLYGEGAFSFSGQLTGLSLADFLTGNLSSFVQANPSYNYTRQQYVGIYAQDSWKIRPNLTLSYGLRWEPFLATRVKDQLVSHFDLAAFTANTHSTVYPTAPAGVTYPGDPGFPDNSGYFSKLNVFAPRVGVVWSPGGNSGFTIRSSYGIFYNRPQLLFDYQYGFEPPWGIQVTLTNPAGGFANPWSGYAGGNPFPRTPGAVFFPPSSAFINMPLHPNPPSMQQWNLTLQKQIGTNWLFSASYLGNELTHLWASQQMNPAVYLPGATLGNLQTRRVLSQINPTQGALISTLMQLDDGGTGNYNGLLLSAQKRMAHGVTLLANYTWSHCISDPPATNIGTGLPYVIPNDRRADRGPCSPSDIRQLFNVSAVAQTPRFSQRWLAAVGNNWQVSTILAARSGGPLNVTTGADNALSGQSNERPNLIGDPIPGTQSYHSWLLPGAFSAPTPGNYGNLGIYALRGPRYLGLDASLVRIFPVRERYKVEFRAEAFNILNHLNANNPVTTLSSGNFGQVTSALDPRILQGALKFIF